MYSKALHTVGLAIDGAEKWRLLEDGTLYRLSDGLVAGGILSGFPVVYKFPFTYATAGLENGVTVYTPEAGDVLLDAWITVSTTFDGTTPNADVGTFSGETSGLFSYGAGAISLGADGEDRGAGYLLSSSNMSIVQSSATETSRAAPGVFTATNPFKLVVSQTGQAGGAAIGGAAGAATLYFIIAKPVSVS